MYQHNIDEMVEALVKAGIVGLNDTNKAKNALTQYWTGRIAIVWDGDDLRTANGEDPHDFRAADEPEELLLGRPLTEDECDEILQNVLNKNYASLGVTWDTLDAAIREFKNDKDFNRKLQEPIDG